MIEAGDDSDPDTLSGGGGNDGLIGARTDNPDPFNSGKSTLVGGPGSDLLVGGDPCDGDLFDGGAGNDNASFFRFNPGVSAQIGGAVSRDGGGCDPGHVDSSVESLEGSDGPDVLLGDSHGNSLIGAAATTCCGASAATTAWSAGAAGTGSTAAPAATQSTSSLSSSQTSA